MHVQPELVGFILKSNPIQTEISWENIKGIKFYFKGLKMRRLGLLIIFNFIKTQSSKIFYSRYTPNKTEK